MRKSTGCSPRTLRRWLLGQPLRPASRAALDRAAEDLGVSTSDAPVLDRSTLTALGIERDTNE